jgi:molybdopterin-guanine dinucleotide biosynthesis protein A
MLGLVLAGGESKRMGSDKALVEIAGSPMIAWVVMALEEVCGRVLIAGRPDGWQGREGLADEATVRGPLAGLVPALQLGEPVLLVAVDQPWVRTETLMKLAEVGATAVPDHQNVRQVTCACYYPDLAAVARDEAETGGSLQSLLDRIGPLEITEPVWNAWGEDGRSWFSVDRREDIEIGLTRFGLPGT